MKTPLKIAAICALLAPVTGFAQAAAPSDEVIEVTDEMMESLRAAITDVGCTVADDEQAGAVETTTGYDEETLVAIIEKLRVYDEIVDASSDGGITLVSGACAN